MIPQELKSCISRFIFLVAYEYLKEGWKLTEVCYFQLWPVPEQEAINTNSECSIWIESSLFNVRVTEHWPTLPREFVEFPSLEIFRRHLGNLLEQGWTRWPPEVWTPTIMLFSLFLSLSLSFQHEYCKLTGNINRNFILPVDFCDENRKVITEEYDAQKEKYYLTKLN